MKLKLFTVLLILFGVLAGFMATKLAGASASNFDLSLINSGDTAWVLTAAALVMIMTRRQWVSSTGGWLTDQ